MKPLHIQSLEKILNELQPEFIPEEFVSAASVTTRDGERKLFTADEYKEFLEDNADEIMDVRVLVDMEKARDVINEITWGILKNIDA